MKPKLLLLFVIVVFTAFTTAFAEDVTTTFYYPNWVENDKFKERAALYQVRLTPFFTYVTIKVVPTKNKKRQEYWASKEACVVAGSAKLPLLGAQGKDNTYHNCSYGDHWGWKDAKEGQEYYYTLMFSGRIPEGIMDFSLEDNAPSGRGYSFRNYTINNPFTHTLLKDEGYCRKNADQNNDGICGIYEEIGGNRERIACIKENGKYYLIYLSCHDRLTWWFQGDLKAELEESATLGTLKANWIMRNKTVNYDAFVTFDGKGMKSYITHGSPTESSYIKMYPTASLSAGDGTTGVSSNPEGQLYFQGKKR